MIEIKYPNGADAPLWIAYAKGGWQATGFIGFVRQMCPYANVVWGTTATGLTLRFDNEKDATWFTLQWL